MRSLKSSLELRNRRSAWLPGVLCSAIAACIALPVMAADTPPTKSKTAPKAAQTAPATATSAGLVVARDVDTGLLRAPTAAEAAALGGQPAVASAITFTNAAGVPGARLAEDSMSYAVVTRSTDGTLTMACVDGAANAAAALHGKPLSSKHVKATAQESNDETK